MLLNTDVFGWRKLGGLRVPRALYIRNVIHFENRYKKEAAHTALYYVFHWDKYPNKFSRNKIVNAVVNKAAGQDGRCLFTFYGAAKHPTDQSRIDTHTRLYYGF